jgi:hypothetical protein
MRAPGALGALAGRGVDANGCPSDLRPVDPSEHDPRHHPGSLARSGSGFGVAAPPEQLRGNRRPRGVGVAVVQLEAVQARPVARPHERPDDDRGLGEHDRQVGHVATQPVPVQVGRQHVRRDGDGEMRSIVSFGGHDARALAVQRARDRLRRATAARHRDDGADPLHGGFGQQHRLDLAQQFVAFGQPSPREHREPGQPDARNERGDQPLGGLGHVEQRDDGRVDPDLQARRRAPHERIPWVELQHHADRMPRDASRARALCTGSVGA